MKHLSSYFSPRNNRICSEVQETPKQDPQRLDTSVWQSYLWLLEHNRRSQGAV